RRMAEEFDVDAIGTMSVLIERKHDHVARFESLDDSIERAALAHDAKSGAIEPPCDKRVEPARLDRPPHEMEAAVHFRIALDPCDRGDFPVAEVSGQEQN